MATSMSMIKEYLMKRNLKCFRSAHLAAGYLIFLCFLVDEMTEMREESVKMSFCAPS